MLSTESLDNRRDLVYIPRMAEPAQPPTPLVSPERFEEIFGDDPAKWPHPATPAAAKVLRRLEEIIPDGYTLRVELIDNRNGAIGGGSKQLTIVDLGDNPELVRLAGVLVEIAHKSLDIRD